MDGSHLYIITVDWGQQFLRLGTYTKEELTVDIAVEMPSEIFRSKATDKWVFLENKICMISESHVAPACGTSIVTYPCEASGLQLSECRTRV